MNLESISLHKGSLRISFSCECTFYIWWALKGYVILEIIILAKISPLLHFLKEPPHPQIQGHKTDSRLQEICCVCNSEKPWNWEVAKPECPSYHLPSSFEKQFTQKAVSGPAKDRPFPLPTIHHKNWFSDSSHRVLLHPWIPSSRVWECQPLRSIKVCSCCFEVELKLFFHFPLLTISYIIDIWSGTVSAEGVCVLWFGSELTLKGSCVEMLVPSWWAFGKGLYHEVSDLISVVIHWVEEWWKLRR